MTAAAIKLTDLRLVQSPTFPVSWTAFSDAKLTESEPRTAERKRMVNFLESGRVFELGEGLRDETPNSLSVTRAVQFIKNLPESRQMPKVSSDGEGDVLFVWEGQRTILVTVEGDRLHAVINAGEQESVHLNDISYLGGIIPSAVVNALPNR